jgi:hypothetical protein
MAPKNDDVNSSTDATRERRMRTLVVTYFPMFIATLSLVTSIYNGYLNGRFVDLIQNNVARVEYMKTCKETIDAYFQIKVRAQMLSATGERERATPQQTTTATLDGAEGAAAVARFAALGTYLANLRDEAVRVRYTELTGLLDRTMVAARQTPPANLPALFEPADAVFHGLNEDCVRSAKGQSFR